MAKRRESKANALKRYRGLVDNAVNWRNTEGYDSLWWRMIDLYRGRQVIELTPEDRITVNVSFGTINVIFPSVSVNYPKITVQPNQPEQELPAAVVEGLVNWQWRHFSYQPHFRSATKDWLMIGHGWLKVGYAFKEKEVKLNDDELGEEYGAQVAEADEYAAEYPDMAAELPTDDEIYEHLSDKKLITVEDQPYVERVSPFDMYVDPAATCLEDAQWICQKIIRPLDEVRKDDSYKRSVRLAVEGDGNSYSYRDDREWRKRENYQNPEMSYVTIWEFYDLSSQTMCVWANSMDEYLVDSHELPFAFGHPFVMIRNYDVPEHFYPMGDLESIESLQMELNKTRSQMMQARKKFGRKYLVKESAFGPEGRQALASDIDNTFVPVADEGTPFAELVQPLPQVQFPPEIYNYTQVVEQDIATVSGVSEYQRGQIPETRRTATEAAIISDSVSARSADKLATVEKCLAAVAERVVQVTQQFVTGEQVYRVMGPDGAYVWIDWTREQIQGEYDFAVEAGSTQPQNETVRRQTAVAISQTMAPYIQMGVVDPAQMARYLLQYGFGVTNPDKFLTPMANQMGMQQQPGMEQGPGAGGMQEPPMGGGYIDQETGNTANQELEQGIPPELLQQLSGQVGLALPEGF